MADPTPVPVVTNPPNPDITPPDEYNIFGIRISKKVAHVILGIFLLVAANRGWLTIDQAKQFLASFEAKPTETVTETTTVTKVGDNPPVVDRGSQLSDWLNSDQGQQLIQALIAKLPDVIDKVVNPPAPKPTVDPTVNPKIPINPQPSPQPAAGLKLVFTDSQKNPVTSTSVATGQMIRVMVTGTTAKVGWSYGSHGSAEVFDLPQELGYDFVLKDSSAYVDFTVFDATLAKVTARIAANQAPQPPPAVDPQVTPVTPVTPVQPVDGSLRVLMLFESKANNTAEQLTALNSTKLISIMNSMCVKDSNGVSGWRRWDKDLDVSKDVKPWPDLMAAVKTKAMSDPNVGLPAIAIIRGSSIKLAKLSSESQAIALVQGN